MKKYNREQLSRILGAASCGILGDPKGGARTDGLSAGACIEQAALATFTVALLEIEKESRGEGDRNRGYAFDAERSLLQKHSVLTDPDAMLQWMRQNGMA